MANEGSLTFALSVTKIPPMVSPDGLNLTDFQFNVSSGLYSKGVVLISHSALTAIPLGQVTSPSFAVLINTDSTNYLTLYNTNSGDAESKIARLKPGYPCIIPFDPSVVPYGEANTADCYLQYLIFSG